MLSEVRTRTAVWDLETSPDSGLPGLLNLRLDRKRSSSRGTGQLFHVLARRWVVE